MLVCQYGKSFFRGQMYILVLCDLGSSRTNALSLRNSGELADRERLLSHGRAKLCCELLACLIFRNIQRKFTCVGRGKPVRAPRNSADDETQLAFSGVCYPPGVSYHCFRGLLPGSVSSGFVSRLFFGRDTTMTARRRSGHNTRATPDAIKHKQI